MHLVLLLQFQHRKFLSFMQSLFETVGSLMKLLTNVLAHRQDKLTLGIPVVIVEHWGHCHGLLKGLNLAILLHFALHNLLDSGKAGPLLSRDQNGQSGVKLLLESENLILFGHQILLLDGVSQLCFEFSFLHLEISLSFEVLFFLSELRLSFSLLFLNS